MRKAGFCVASMLLLILAPAGVVSAAAQSASAGVCGSWVQQTSANAGTGDNNLNGVGAISASNVWAVGYYFVGADTATLIEHWDGTSWSVVPSPNAGKGTNELFAVRGTSPDNIWAVGDTFTGYPASKTLILHWDGSHWRVVASPNAGTGNNLNAVFALSPGSIWVAGDYNNGSPDQTLIEYCG